MRNAQEVLYIFNVCTFRRYNTIDHESTHMYYNPQMMALTLLHDVMHM